MKKQSLLLSLLLTYFLVSCGSENIIIPPKKLTWDHPEKVLIDSIYISKVEDNRKNSLKKLGNGYTGLFNSPTPIVFNKNLADYLKMNFNNLLSKSKDSSSSILISVEISKLLLGEQQSFMQETAFSKYSYTFTYPKGNGIKKVVIVDSIEISSGNDATANLPTAFYNGIKRTSQVFSDFYKTNPGSVNERITSDDYTLSLISSEKNMSSTPKSIDTIRVIDKTKKRSILSLGYYQAGTLLSGGVNLGYFSMFNKDGSHFEYGSGTEINILNVKQRGNLSSSSFVSYNVPLIGRYYFQKNPQYFFLTGTLKINGGTETIDYGYNKDMNFFIGPTFELGLGFQIGQIVDLTASVHQIYNWGSEILPNDFGLNFNAHISFGYK
jgi:hypothetical protein